MRFALLILLAGTVSHAAAQEGLRSSRPMGFFGQGHEQFHDQYKGLVNADKGSCCSGKDGRPTQARWNGFTWDVMIDGQWRTMRADEGYKVLTPEVFASQGRERWDSQAHVFTSEDGSVIWCLVPPTSGG